ncbi:MAG TPA: NAD-dependent epimerase/dehydratase family protein [Terriglobales bacterium]|nr:NAD-dependent epimerase/dehydratase family protein [Terriglobales bacterium]
MSWLDGIIFVTGATGFIGGRVCERLVQAGARRVRALVHNMHRAARIGRLPIELCPGNLLETDSLRQPLADSTIVIHCGLGNARGIVRGTENLLSVCREGKVKRFVHMSTAAVYGLTPPPGSETEDAPLRLTGDGYCDNKGRAERAVLRAGQHGLPVVILRPSIVYGPYSAWSTRLIEDLREHRVALIDRGTGACNTTYVDNLIDAVFASLENDEAIGHTFFITDGEAVTWGDFIRAHRDMLGHKEELPQLTGQDALAYYKERPGVVAGSLKAANRILRSRELRQLLLQIPVTERTLSALWGRMQSLPETKQQSIRSRVGVLPKSFAPSKNGRFVPDEVTIATQTGTVFFSIEKAKRILGYRPRILFPQGTALVEQWLRFANYL